MTLSNAKTNVDLKISLYVCVHIKFYIHFDGLNKDGFRISKMLLEERLGDSNNLFPVGIYLLKVNNRNTRTRCEICSKLTI